MKDSFSQSMDWLHTWAGLLFGWLLFAIFFTGTLTVFDQEITYWMQPELHHVTPAPLNVEAAVHTLEQFAPEADRWWIELPNERRPISTIRWSQDGTSGFRVINSQTGQPLTLRATHGGEFFYRFHYQLLLDQFGTWIVGAAAMAMLIALVTGIIIHHRIFKDFFTFRPQASSHRAWLDAHNVAGILGFPFHLMITFTGLVIFWSIYMPAGIQVQYDGDMDDFWAEAESFIEPERANQKAPLVSLGNLERQARAYWQGGQTRSIVVSHPGDRHALVHIYRRSNDRLSLYNDRVSFDGSSGVLRTVWINTKPAYMTQSVLSGLHFVQFGGAKMRWLYFGMGLAASAMIATGLVLWVVKRQGRHTATGGLGFQLVEGFNVAAVAGLLVATATFFWANRLLPADLPAREIRELQMFFTAWMVCLVYALLKIFFRHSPTLRIWTIQLSIGAMLFGLLPIVNAITTESHLLHALSQGRWEVAGFDLSFLVSGLGLAWTARRLDQSARASSRHWNSHPVASGG